MNSLPSWRQLLLFAVLIPAGVAISNQLLFWYASAPWLQSWLYPWMAFSTAALSWCVGRYLSPAWLRWLVFAWCLALLDLLTIAACIGGPIDDHFGYLMVTSQMSLVILWGILGMSNWQWRMPVVLVGTALVTMFHGVLSGRAYGRWGADTNWTILLIISTAVIALLCASLRISGFCCVCRKLPRRNCLNARQTTFGNSAYSTCSFGPRR